MTDLKFNLWLILLFVYKTALLLINRLALLQATELVVDLTGPSTATWISVALNKTTTLAPLTTQKVATLLNQVTL